MKIIILNLFTLIINLSLVLISSFKLTKLAVLKEEFLASQKNIEELLNETSYLSNNYLDGLEAKITEGKKLLADISEEERRLKKEVVSTNEIEEDLFNPVTREIAKMFKEGKTIMEIAEKLNTTQGEVALRLNLGKKITGQD